MKWCIPRTTVVGHSINWILVAILGGVLAGTAVGCTRTPSGDIIIYRRSGGFAGLDDLLVISGNYEATFTQKTGRRMFAPDQKVVERLQQQLDQAKFSQLKKEYLPANTCCDLFEYTITYKRHTVRTMDTAVPELLQPVLDTLNEIIETGGKP